MSYGIFRSNGVTPSMKRQFPNQKYANTLIGTELEVKIGRNRSIEECYQAFKRLTNVHGDNNRFYSIQKMWDYIKLETPNAIPIEPLYQRHKDNTPFGGNLKLSEFVDALRNITLSWDDCDISNVLEQIGWDSNQLERYQADIRKILKANLKYPVIINERGDLIDGNHRLIQALVRHQKTIECVKVDLRVYPCDLYLTPEQSSAVITKFVTPD